MNSDAKQAASPASPPPVAAIGASAGGLAQIKLLLDGMPPDTGAAFVVIQHLDPNHKSQLPELLRQASKLPVVAITDHMEVYPDRIHVLPSGHRLSIDEEGVFHLTASRGREATPTLIDHFFRDLATAFGRRATGIVLSGTGSDGALGLKAIRTAGGLAIAQLPADAEFSGMPRAAAQYASPDCMLRTADMIGPLRNHLQATVRDADPSTRNATAKGRGEVSDESLAAVLTVLRDQGHYDFRYHKTGMLKRRIQRRLTLKNVPDIQTYLRMLASEESERTSLRNDFLISVTDFFREPQSYAALNKQVIQKLLRSRNRNNPVRAWVPGCATGEEAYSIAMLISEAVEASGRDCKYVIFATDIDERALAQARSGVYPESIEADISHDRLHAYFNRIDDHYQVKRSLREHVVFAPQNVTDDPPYSKLDIISCRNLLIYINAEVQRRLITLFHFALNDIGYLFLGSSETIGDQTDLFEPIAREHRIYRRLAASHPYHVGFLSPRAAGDALPGYPANDQVARPKNAGDIARDILLAEFVPASVLVNRKLEILCSYGPTHDFFSLPPGESSLDLLAMVHEEYRSHVRALTHRAFRSEQHGKSCTRIRDSRGQTLVITARPLSKPEPARGLVLITFATQSKPYAPAPRDLGSGDVERQLAEELDATRNELHATITSLEESNEDLKSYNEEIMSMNEELQSTNEELETSKEELQSVNEELSTVNTELESKVQELESARNDLSNFFTGTHVATLFLDRQLRIKRFTPAIRNLLSLISGDIGRPLRDITLKFTDPDLLTDAERVLEELSTREAEIMAGNRHWYQRRIMPYRTRENVIDGVVIIFTDVTELRHAMRLAQKHELRLDLAVGALNGGMWEMKIDPEQPEERPAEVYLSTRLKRLLGYEDSQMPNSLEAWTNLIAPEDRAAFNDPERRRTGGSADPVQYRIRHRDGHLRWFCSYGKLLADKYGEATRWLGIDCDITETKHAQIDAERIQGRFNVLANALPELVAFNATDDTIVFTNSAWRDWFNAGETVGQRLNTLLGKATFAQLAACRKAALAGKPSSCMISLRQDTQVAQRLQATFVPHRIGSEIEGYYLVLIHAPANDEELADSPAARSRVAYIYRTSTIGEMASTLAHDLIQPLSAINNYASSLTRMVYANKPADETATVVRKMADQVTRANVIINDVRDFVGRRETNHVALDINPLLHSVVALTAGYARELGVSVTVEETVGLPAVEGDAVQIEQVLINLVNNACEAMRDVAKDRRTLQLKVAIVDNAQVQITVADSGPGIPVSKLDAVFDPFVSTKLEGAGMGLSISRSIAAWHGGSLHVESEEGHGAAFHLRLPIKRAHPEAANGHTDETSG